VRHLSRPTGLMRVPAARVGPARWLLFAATTCPTTAAAPRAPERRSRSDPVRTPFALACASRCRSAVTPDFHATQRSRVPALERCLPRGRADEHSAGLRRPGLPAQCAPTGAARAEATVTRAGDWVTEAAPVTDQDGGNARKLRRCGTHLPPSGKVRSCRELPPMTPVTDRRLVPVVRQVRDQNRAFAGSPITGNNPECPNPCSGGGHEHRQARGEAAAASYSRLAARAVCPRWTP
jgi:hypothetical protein